MINKVDIENIEKELKARKAASYSIKSGGTLSKEELKGKSESELKQLISDFKSSKETKAIKEIKGLVDNLFKKYGEEGDNMIAISCAYVPERKTYADEEGPLSAIDFNGFGHKYNKLYYPICSDWECANYWDRKDRIKEELEEWDEKWEEYWQDIDELQGKLDDIDIPTAEEYWESDNDALNECWYGVIGIMKDYRIVAFVIRNDGMLSDEDDYESFYNKVVRKL